VYVSFDDSEETEKTIFDELDHSKVGVGDIWDYTHGNHIDFGEDFYGFWGAYNDVYSEGSSIFLNSKEQYEQDLYNLSFLSDEGIKSDKGIVYGFQLFNAVQNMSYAAVYIPVCDATNERGCSLTGMDVTSWEGLCVVYSSTVPITVSFNEKGEVSTREVEIPASKDTRLIKLPWKGFKYGSWVSEINKTDLEDGLKNVGQFTFRVDKVTAESGEIYIKAIGKYNGCSTK